MIPQTWEPHYRYDDGELVGYLEPAGPGLMQPRAVFGHPLGEPTTRLGAEQRLEDVGLSYLAEPWGLRTTDGRWQRVHIVEAAPSGLTVSNGDVAIGGDIGERIRLEVPVPDGRLLPWADVGSR